MLPRHAGDRRPSPRTNSEARAGFEPDLTGLKDRQPHQKSNGPCLWTYLLRHPGSPVFIDAGWKALESLSPGLQPGATPSQLPAHSKEKARCHLRDTGLLSSRRPKADVTCAGDTGILRLANPDYPNPQIWMSEIRDTRVARRVGSLRRRTASYRSVSARASTVKAS